MFLSVHPFKEIENEKVESTIYRRWNPCLRVGSDARCLRRRRRYHEAPRRPAQYKVEADGIKQTTKGEEVPISGKFELDDNGKLSLSVYTAEKGLSVLPEKNVLKELAGSPEQAAWTPESEVFKDVEHIARSSQHLVLNALSQQSLLAIVEDASKHATGLVYSIDPTLHGRKAVFEVLVANKDKVSKLTYDIPSGKFLGKK